MGAAKQAAPLIINRKGQSQKMTIPKQVLVGLDDVVTHLTGQNTGGRQFEVRRREIDVREIRERLSMTQKEFAVRFGFSLKTLQNWEQGIREPEGPARSYLAVIKYDPSAVIAALFEEARSEK